jgi:hypothetical protein
MKVLSPSPTPCLRTKGCDPSQDITIVKHFKNPWPVVVPIDEKIYHIELKDGTIVRDIEYWAFGGGFGPECAINGFGSYVKYPLDDIVSFQLVG